MKNPRGIALSLVLLCTFSAFAQSAAPKKEDAPIGSKWTLARKNMQTVYAAFVHAASRNERSVFSDRFSALLDATSQMQHAQQDMLAEPGAPYRELFTRKTVMCQRSAFMFWKDQDEEHPNQAPVAVPPEVVTCMKMFAQPDPDLNQ
jgi:hypothetical protein